MKRGRGRLPLRERAALLEQLSALASAGRLLSVELEELSGKHTHPAARHFLSGLEQGLAGEGSFATGLKSHGAALEPADMFLLSSAYEVGRLAEGFSLLSAQALERARARAAIKGPLLAGSFCLMVTVSVPTPWSGALQRLVAGAAISLFICWLLSRCLKALQPAAFLRFRCHCHRMAWNAPLFSRVIRAPQRVAYFWMLGAAYETGVPIVRSTELARDTMRNAHARRMGDGVTELLSNGGLLAEALSSHQLLESGEKKLVENAERTGHLAQAFETISRQARTSSEQQFKRAGAWVVLLPYVVLLAVALLAVVALAH